MTDDTSSGEVQTDETPSGDLWLQSPAEATAALSSPLLVPPPQPATLAPGPTADLRSAMARFSAGDDHGERRRTVVQAVERLQPEAVADIAREETASSLAIAGPAAVDAIADIAFIVPTRALVGAMEPSIEPTALDRIVGDVATMVSVIGRGAPSSPESDSAVTRLLDRFDQTDSGRDRTIATLSLLYQNHDATAALIGVALIADATGEPRRSPLAKTVRVATAQTAILGRAVAPGGLIIVPLDSSENEFGAGPHRCPGQELAEVIAAAVLAAIADSGYRVSVDRVAYGDDGRPTAIPIEPIIEQKGDRS